MTRRYFELESILGELESDLDELEKNLRSFLVKLSQNFELEAKYQ